MKILPIFLFLGTFIGLFFLRSDLVLSDYSDFVISEIMYDPAGADKDREWVEVFNNATVSATVVGGSVSNSLRFYDGSNHTLAASAFQGALTIDSQTYFILASDAANFKSLYPSFSGTLIEVSAMNLGNTSKTVSFRIGSAGDLFSSLTYESSWGGNDNGQTIEKKVLTDANDGSNWTQSSAALGTPGVGYSVPPPVVYPTTVKINEFLPDPETGEEWVELFNSDPSQKVTLNNWQLDDVEGSSSPQTFSRDFDPLSYWVVYFSANKLNNSGDSLRLIRPDGIVSDSFNYSESVAGVSYAWDGSDFLQTKTPTPGGLNLITPVKEKHQGKLLELKRLPIGSEIKFDGWVIAPANLLGDKDFYVSDGETGIKVAYTMKPSFKIEVADRVAVGSSLQESYDEKYIKTETVNLVQKNASRIEARKILTGEAKESWEGMLLKVVGKLVENSGETFYLDDGSGRTKIYLRDSTGIVKPSLKENDEVAVVGILSQYGFLKNGEANYRILPRFQSDIVNLTQSGEAPGKILGSQAKLKELPQTGPADFYTWGWILVFLGLALRLKYSDACR